MFTNLFYGLRAAQLPVSLKEYLALLQATKAGLAALSVDDFYYLARASLVKDERHLDRFDQVFGQVFKGVEAAGATASAVDGQVPDDWLRRLAELDLTEEEKRQVEALGGFEALMEALRERLAQQTDRHQGGDRMIGTAGRSPFGAYGYNPEGVRIGQSESRHRRATKVWDRREFRNLDDTVELGTRNIKVALRRLRRFARHGAAETLDLGDTIRSTARRGGMLDLKLVPERHNAAKVLLFLDVGGSMNPYVRVMEELFSAARSEFKHLEWAYFHNCPYESVWRDNRRRHDERIDTWDLIHTYPRDYRLIFVGDAVMSPYEISHPGGSVEHWNAEAGQVWMQRLLEAFPKAVWLTPTPMKHWTYHLSLQMVQELMEGRMYPLTLDGLDAGMRELSR